MCHQFPIGGFQVNSDPDPFILSGFSFLVASFLELPLACAMFSQSSASDLIKSV